MMRATIDTNILASGAVAREGGTIATIVAAIRSEYFELALSDHILDELARTLVKPYFTYRLSVAELLAYQTMILSYAMIFPVSVQVRGDATHPEDDLILATAVSADAEFLVTGDAQLLKLGNYRGVTILSPRAFLDLLNSEQTG